jgi:hypothetical protein
VLSVARYPYLVYYQVRENEVVVLHIRDGRREPVRESDL